MSQSAAISDVQDDVLAVSRAWVQAEIRGDLQTVAEILADDYKSVTSTGAVMTKHDWLELLPSFHFEALSLEEVSIQLHGSTAIVRGVLTSRVQVGDKQTSGRYRSTDVFVSEGGRWKAVASQLTRLNT